MQFSYCFLLFHQQRPHIPWDNSPSHSTWLHTLRWPHWLYPVAARPVRWCVLWYPWPGWKSLERELVRWSQKEEKKEEKTILAHCFLSVLHVVFSLGDTESVLRCSPKSPTLCSCWETQTVGQATRQSLPFVFELGFHSKAEALQSCVWPHCWIARARMYSNTNVLMS